jgi:hypothetical protein
MGQTQFQIADPARFHPDVLAAAHMVGIDGVPWPCQVKVDGRVLKIMRHASESGKLVVVYASDEFGAVALTTATLPERARPYWLEIELARGTLGRLRNQLALWQEGGLVVAAELHTALAAASTTFTAALFSIDHDVGRAARLAHECTDQSLGAMYVLAESFCTQVAQLRQSRNVASSSVLGVSLPFHRATQIPSILEPSLGVVSLPMWSAQPDLTQAANALIGLDAEVERRRAAGQRVMIGPLLDFSRFPLPPWLASLRDFDDRRQAIRQATAALCDELAADIKVCHVCSGVSGIGHAGFTFPQQLHLVMDILEVLESRRPDLATIVSLDQPWGERLAWSMGGQSALSIADTLLRHGAQLTGLGLDIHLDYWPHGSLVRDPLQWVDLTDRWSQFGLPLFVFLAAPLLPPGWQPDAKATELRIRRSLTRDQTHRHITTIARLCLARTPVEAVVWSNWFDDDPRYPFSGIVDLTESPKPIAKWLAESCRSDQPANV